MHPKYQYVPGPNTLWHIGGLHKLIRWGLWFTGVLTASQGLWFFWNAQWIIEQKLSCPPLWRVQEGMGYRCMFAPIMDGKMMMSADSWSRLGGKIKVHIYKVHLCTISVLRGCTGTLHGVVYLAFTECSTTWRTKGFSISLMTQVFSAFITHFFHTSIEHWKNFAWAGIIIA